jgi:hypothetical protein
MLCKFYFRGEHTLLPLSSVIGSYVQDQLCPRPATRQFFSLEIRLSDRRLVDLFHYRLDGVALIRVWDFACSALLKKAASRICFASYGSASGRV